MVHSGVNLFIHMVFYGIFWYLIVSNYLSVSTQKQYHKLSKLILLMAFNVTLW